jgi:tetraacyldisaccharide 4'-kinase
LWRWGARRTPEPRSLDVPVISVGNITMGGTGKTPCVLRLAEELSARGRAPGILTRGHGRRSLESALALAPGERVPVERSGDEPQIFLRSGLAPIGIGADRWKAGRLVLRRFPVDRFLLDDGFQHRRLARKLDIVLIDALNPFGGGNVFPLGRLREPLEALARAHILLITRADLNDAAPAVERALRQWNPDAPVFRASLTPQAWVEHRTRREFTLAERPFHRPAAFCGLGNPDSFRRTLERMGLTLAGWVEFGDHHRYRPDELRRIAHQMAGMGAHCLVTTEKDTINLCEFCDDLLAPLPLYWLKVRMTVENEAGFFEEIERQTR